MISSQGINERYIQSLLMEEMLGRQHVVAVPNSRYLSLSEADLLTVTKAGFVNEFEIKLTRSDYNAEFRAPFRDRRWRKSYKHRALKWAFDSDDIWLRTPNYFWFVTYDFEIEPPEYAGWLEVVKGHNRHTLEKRTAAPRLHSKKVSDGDIVKMARILSYRLMNVYKKAGE